MFKRLLGLYYTAKNLLELRFNNILVLIEQITEPFLPYHDYVDFFYLYHLCAATMEIDLSASEKNGELYLEDPFDGVST